MTPILTYHGGKQRMAKHILPLIPPHHCYIEPFCGGAAVFWAKEPAKIEVLNDKRKDLYYFYCALQQPMIWNALLHRLEFTPYSRSMFNEAKLYLKQIHEDPLGGEHDMEAYPLEFAWAFYVCNMLSFGAYDGQRANYGYEKSLSKDRGGSKTQANVFIRKKKLLKSQLERMLTVQIECLDALDLIKRYDSPQAFFYCDPPYVGTGQGSYAAYNHDEFVNLVNVLNKSQGSFVLSCYEDVFDTPTFPNDLSHTWECREVQALVSIASYTGKANKSIERLYWKYSDWAVKELGKERLF